MPSFRILVGAAALLVFGVVAMAATTDKIWPDFSCHPRFNDTRSPQAARVNRVIFNRCVEKEKKTKVCHKLCIMNLQDMMFQYSNQYDEDITFKIVSMVDHLAAENGYKDGTYGGDAAKLLMNKVRDGMIKCAETHKEFARRKMNTTCEQWNPFFKCIDGAYGC